MRGLEHGDPRAIGRYRLLARIGAGGMAVIYLGRSSGGRAAAVKMVHAEFAQDQGFRDRFRREVAATRAVGGLCSPSLLDADPDAETPWLATEFLPSMSLREAVRRFGVLPAGSVRPLAAGLVEALASIHRAGIVHLDLKPANVLLTTDGPKVIDFGIAGISGITGESGESGESGEFGRAADAGTYAAGSPGYMSPEQTAGAPAGTPSDVFSFGSTLAYACTGRAPQGGEMPVQPEGSADDTLRAVIADCLRAGPAERPAVHELAGRLAPERRGDDEHSGSDWLPPGVTAEIDRRIGEADNPPAARPHPSPVAEAAQRRRGTGRRRLLLWGGAAVVAAGGAGMLALSPDQGGNRDKDRDEARGKDRGDADANAPGPQPEPSGTSTSEEAAPRALEFLVSGDVTLASLSYTVNGESSTLTDVALPWRKVVEVPPWPERADWRIEYDSPPGEVDYRVLVDGFRVAGGTSSSTGEGHEGGGDGVN